jgi:hypothetical protein
VKKLHEQIAQILLVHSLSGPEKISKILSFYQKFFNFLICRQTGRQADKEIHAFTSIYEMAKKINAFFDTFNLTTFIKDKALYKG